jgi:hypothetical protein
VYGRLNVIKDLKRTIHIVNFLEQIGILLVYRQSPVRVFWPETTVVEPKWFAEILHSEMGVVAGLWFPN